MMHLDMVFWHHILISFPVVLKVNTTQESYVSYEKGLFLDGFPWPGLTLKITESRILR